MKSTVLKKISFCLVCCMLFSLISCTKKEIGEAQSDFNPPPPEEETVETVDLVSEGKFRFTIIRSKQSSAVALQAAAVINNHIMAQGMESALFDQADKNGDAQEILVGRTENFPEEAMKGIDLSAIGVNGFVIRHWGNKILLVANNDAALVHGAEYFVANFLNIKDGKASMPKDYFHVESTGLFLSRLCLGGVDISQFAIACDAGLEEPASYVKDLVLEKCGVALSDTGEKKILLTTQGAVPHRVTAGLENGDLVIRAENLAAMKKAVVCFWYETIAYSVGSFDLPANTAYSRDLDQTIFYSDYGVIQSNSICCLEQLYEVHEEANRKGYKVFADYGATYYISSTSKSVIVNTDVEWGNARFTIDDSAVTTDQRSHWIFKLPKKTGEYTIDTIETLDRDTTNLGRTFPERSIVTFHDENTMQYIRSGSSADNGYPKKDSVVVDRNGNTDIDAPLMWDFERITSINVLPIHEETRYIGGGIFTTVANQAPTGSSYYGRGIRIMRSNTVINGIQHNITGEGDHGAPYHGFIYISTSAYVTVKNCVLSGHKYYNAGTYDIGMTDAISVSFVNCYQANDITDKSFWGISATHYCKNFVYDSCLLSRYDAHKGVANGTIRNSVIGYAGASIIGYGTFLVENTTFLSNKLIELRRDYGSTWEGDVIIRNCTVAPEPSTNVNIFLGENKGDHDFGYLCYMPKNVTVEGLNILNAKKAYLFGNFNSNCTSMDYVSPYPFFVTERVTLKNVTFKSRLEISPNNFLFAQTQIVKE